MDSVECRAESKDKKPSKMHSAKLWIAIWAVAMVTFIVVADRSSYVDIAKWLCGVVLMYFGVNVVQKKIFSDSGAGGVFDTLFPDDGKGEWSADAPKETQ